MPQDGKKQQNQQKEPSVQTGGFIKLLKNIVKLLFNSVVDTPQNTLPQKQRNEIQTQQGSDASGKRTEDLKQKNTRSPKDLDREEVKEAGEGLLNRGAKSGSAQSIKGQSLNQEGIENSTDNTKGIGR